MKVLFFAGGSYIGGMEIVTLNLMKELNEQGHECAAVVSGWNDGAYPKKLEEAGIRHECIKLGRFYLRKPLWNLDGLYNYPRAVMQLRALVDEIQPDVAVLANVEFGLTALQALPRSLPVVLHVHDLPGRHYNSWVGRRVIGKVVGLITVSDFIAKNLERLSIKSVSVRTVPNGVPQIHNLTRNPHHGVNIGIIGQLLPRKRHEILVQAISWLENDVRNKIIVMIYGDDQTSYADEIATKIRQAGIKRCFHWIGFVSSQQEIYGNLDLVIAPAVDEPFGLTIIEAGAYGLPVIASRSGGFREIILDNETGLLVTPDNPAEFAEAIKRLLDPVERERLGSNAQRHVRESFSMRKMAESFLDALKSFGISA